MRRVLSRLRQNLPGAKPEFWRDPRSALRRRLLSAVSRWLDPTLAHRAQITTLHGTNLLIEVTPVETLGSAISLTGVYEFAPTELVQAYLQAGDCFVDVGANIGYYSLIAAHCVGRDGSVIAFEPLPRVRRRLLRNASLNGFEQIEVRAQAVGGVTGTVRLGPPGIAGNDGTASISPHDVPGALDVECVRLEDTLPRPPDFVKIDVEGHEPQVFAGMGSLLRLEAAPTIMFESFRVHEDAAHLLSHGYAIYVPCLIAGRLRLKPLRKDATYYRAWEAPNYLAIKSERGRAFISGRLQRP